MKSETRFIIYTNDAMLLATARFPLYITGWDTLSQSQKSFFIIEDKEEYRFTSKITHIIKSDLKKTKKILPIDEKLFTMPPGFTPKIGKMMCIDDEGRFFEFKRITLHPNFALDPSHMEVLEKIEDIWKKGYSYIGNLIDENPKAKGFLPKYKRQSILQLERVNDSVDKAKNIEILWDIWDQVIQGGNEYAKTPICDVVERTQVSLRQWEYRPRQREEQRR